MAGGLNDPDLDDFLRRVDELEAVVQGTASLDKPPEGGASSSGDGRPNVQQQKEPVDRTVINHAGFKDDSPKSIPGKGAPVSSHQGTDDFMRAIEADADERAEKRRKRKEEATALKNQGNQEFQKGNYTHAVELYSEGLDHLKDFVVLYTNRAQAYNKLDKFTEAIEDCKTALQLEPTNVKAMIHLGKAHQGMKEYDTAIKTYQEILKIDRKYEKMVKEYIKEAQLAESMAASAVEAERLFNEGDTRATGVHQIVTKLRQPYQPVLYYAGGMRILTETMTDDSSRAQFRSFGGFSLLTNHTIIQQSLDEAASGRDLMSSDLDLVCATLDLLTSAVRDQGENIAYLINLSTVPSLLVGLLSKSSDSVQQGTIKLLYTLSKNANGCSKIVERFDVSRLLVALMTYLEKPREESCSKLIANILSSLIQNERFVPRFLATVRSDNLKVNDLDDVNIAFENVLKNLSLDSATLASCIRTVFVLAENDTLRYLMIDKRLIVAVVQKIGTCINQQLTSFEEAILTDLVGLLINLFVKRCPMEGLGLKGELKSLLTMMVSLLQSGKREYVKSAVGLLSRTLPSTSEGVAEIAKQNVIPKVIDAMKTGDAQCNNYAIKCLAVLTQRSERARMDLVRADRDLEYICKQLNSENTISIANAALIVGNCTQVGGLSSALVNTDIIKTLLSKTDTTSAAIKENCAIALAKLATTDERHLEQLRVLGGIGILHSCMRYVKS